ncbi:unnamed protein product [Didymodactylos carnosus]|uniref:ATP-dependent RNA helicase n=1 Tax=Didymodactylos carnosus TaxID=1234261 RepID=A0A8S2CZA4_9BILA|nr:unnamed protein product [Didymodactylos carnosus]CAF3584881.1 unnamed protein product [Didymodactylos carnosus]
MSVHDEDENENGEMSIIDNNLEMNNEDNGGGMEVEEEDDEPFTIIRNETDDTVKKKKYLYRLPEWMSTNAVLFNAGDLTNDDVDDQNEIEQLEYIDNDICSILVNDLSIRRLFPVQKQLIPYIIKQSKTITCVPPSDICVSSPTGTGKTLTYVIPLLQCIRHRITKSIQILIILPVQDLAEQVFNVISVFTKKLNLNAALICGGKYSFEFEQNLLLKKQLDGTYTCPVDIVVCTPGRLVEHLTKTHGFNLEHLRYLVIDEADRIIDEFKQDWLQILESSIFTRIHTNRIHPKDFQPSMMSLGNMRQNSYQKLLFSATLTHNPEILQQLNLFRPILFSDNKRTSSAVSVPSNLKEYYLVCNILYKPLTVAYLIQNQLHSERIIIFVHSKNDVNRLYSLLKILLPDQTKLTFISRHLNMKKIQTRLNLFENGQIQIIVCSDIMARGIDISNIDCVILYDLPRNIRTYIHRVGRTARAGKHGTSLTLVEKERLNLFRLNIKSKRGKKLKYMNVTKENYEHMFNDYQQALETFSQQQQHPSKKTRQKRHT